MLTISQKIPPFRVACAEVESESMRGLDWNCVEALEIVTGLFGLVAIVLTTRWLGMKDRFEPCAQIS
jgi:hypothetical protein